MKQWRGRTTWMAGTSPAMTVGGGRGHDARLIHQGRPKECGTRQAAECSARRAGMQAKALPARLQGGDRQSKTRQDSPLTKDRRTLYSVGTAMGRFETTARTYAARREPYPAEFFAAAADALKLRGDESMIDLGTGPGLLA